MVLDPIFQGQVALVTGGSSGIGRAASLAFAAQGAKVVVASRRIDEGQETVRLIQATGGESIFVRTDVSQAEEVQALMARTVERFGGLDFAFNNAGIEGPAFVPVEQYSEATWDQVIDINLKGVFLSMKFQLPEIVRRKGAIVNMSSVAGLKGGRVGIAYYASKHGVVGMTKAAALEYAGKGVRINAVAPGVIPDDGAELLSRRGHHSGLDGDAPIGTRRRTQRSCQRRGVAVFPCCLVHHRPHAAGRWWVSDLRGCREREARLPDFFEAAIAQCFCENGL